MLMVKILVKERTSFPLRIGIASVTGTAMDQGPSTRQPPTLTVCSANLYPRYISTDNFVLDNEPQSPDTTAGVLPYGQDASSTYPQDVTADGRIEPYGANRNSNRLAGFERRVSSNSTLYPVTYLDQRNSQDSSSSVLLREGLGYPRGQQINSNSLGAMKYYPRGQDMNAGYLAQVTFLCPVRLSSSR
jgi:hypothetical protein